MHALFNKKNTIIFINMIFCVILILIRVQYTKSITYIFLIWNLFLAGIPYIISQLIRVNCWFKKKSLFLLTSLGIWLLFLPNAPYIITDLIHLKYMDSGIIWFDTFLIFLFAVNGLFLGILSMTDVYCILKEKWNTTFASIIIIIIAYLSGFGIYLGRYLRWNSWDFFTNTNALVNDVITNIKTPKAIGLTIGIGSLLLIIFYSFKQYFVNQKFDHH